MEQLCGLCTSIIQSVAEYVANPGTKTWSALDWKKGVQYPSIPHITASAATCPCCKLIVSGVSEKMRKACGEKPLHAWWNSEKLGYAWFYLIGSPAEGDHWGQFQCSSSFQLLYEDYYERKFNPLAAFHRPIWQPGLLDMESRYKPVEQWISYCSKNHESCQEAAEGYPSRLLDLQQAGKSGIIRVVEANSLLRPLPQYTTLSHCWGGSQPLRTTKDNLAQHQDIISLSQLPKTYRDAVKVSLRLDIRYLWIDSLCILQDSREDWEHEAQLMATIYQNSYLTISATSSPDSHGGCFIEERMSDIVEAWCMVQNQPGYITSGRCYYVRFLKVKEEFPKPLQSRGWVLQESSLSRRVLNLTSEQMYWQCKESFDSEDGCTTLGKLEGALSKKPRWFAELDIFWEAPNEWETADSMTRRWHLWAVGYCKRQLTFREDKLPAIAGLIRYHQLQARDEPVLGLWRSTVAVDLRWAVSVPSKNLRVSHFPSWTWLCASSRVWSPWWPHEIKPEDTHVDLQLTDWSIAWSGAPYVSRLLHNRLVVTSRMLHVTLRKDLDKWAVDQNDQRLEDTPFEEYKNHDINSASYIPDEAQTFRRGDKVAFLSLFHDDENRQCHLVLQATGEPGVYSRVGVGYLQFRPRYYMNKILAYKRSDDSDGTDEGEDDGNPGGEDAGIEGIEKKVEEKEQPRSGPDNRAMKSFLNLWETRTIELV